MASLCYAGPVDKARDFMKAGMHKQAESLLEQEINQDPTNAEAHFLLGKCYILLDEFRSFPKAE
ncbi:MAG TPA: tetratricopeptide repeat protein, partial [Patescibacteria group bacterium]|nr:tetratricopeptide repeat protein [Patescibacteria group bacterium]